MLHGSSCLLVYETHLLALLQGNCLDLVRCAFLRKLSGRVKNIAEFCQHLLEADKIGRFGRYRFADISLLSNAVNQQKKIQFASSCKCKLYVSY